MTLRVCLLLLCLVFGLQAEASKVLSKAQHIQTETGVHPIVNNQPPRVVGKMVLTGKQKVRQIQRLLPRWFSPKNEGAKGEPYDAFSLVSFVLGLLSVLGIFLTGVWIGFGFLIFLGPVAVALGIVGIARKRRTGKRGLGLAIAGTALGLIGCLLSLVVLAFALNF